MDTIKRLLETRRMELIDVMTDAENLLQQQLHGGDSGEPSSGLLSPRRYVA